ncbi:MAG TPA: CDP-6-deoxy-delta-3,4-glucoseen reductase [Candidatus Methylomirabilis sp.]|nr:CDP-6-deoxy-delta-3,4-glucoseen reductase [Candidatus Methylomirabilis sp.]
MNFKVRIETSGREFIVEEKETVLAAALRQGVTLAYSCRNGDCGTCKGKIVTGHVDYGAYSEQALSEAEKQAGAALLCQTVPLSDLVIQATEISAAKDIPIRMLPCRVVRMDKLADDVMRLWLKLPEGQRLQFLAGQYIDILLPGNQRRSFSLATAPFADELLQIHVRHVLGGLFSEQVFTRMKEKDLLRFQGPLGTFFLREDSDRPAILVAGGTGFAPIKGILEHAFVRGMDRQLHLYWGVRAQRDLYLPDLPLEWARKYPNFRYTPVLSEPEPDDRWNGRIGWVHAAMIADYPDLSRNEVYASGPPPMIQALKQAAKAHGLPDDGLYYDSFEHAHASAR